MTLPHYQKWLVICSIHSPCCSFFLQWSCDCNKHLLPLLLALDYNNCTATCYCVLCIDNDNKTTSVETSCINSLQICQHQPSPASTASSCIVFYIFDSDIHGYSNVEKSCVLATPWKCLLTFRLCIRCQNRITVLDVGCMMHQLSPDE